MFGLAVSSCMLCLLVVCIMIDHDYKLDLPFEDDTMHGLFHKIEKGEYVCPSHFSPDVKCKKSYQ